MNEEQYGICCPSCGSQDILVIDTRAVTFGRRRRRYSCLICNHRFNTVEVTENHVKKWLELDKKIKDLKKVFNDL